jgi:hypothetical protein
LRNGTSSVAESRVTGKRVFGRVKREPIVVGGSGPLRVSVGVPETGGDKARCRRVCTRVTDYKGAKRPREGRAIFARGTL